MPHLPPALRARLLSLIRKDERVNALVGAPLTLVRDLLYYTLRYLVTRARARPASPPAICFAPEVPHPSFVIWKMCRLLGAKPSGEPNGQCALRVAWDSSTWLDPEGLPAAFRSRATVNGQCVDISKVTVDRALGHAFGYRLGLDPTTHAGVCVEKSNENQLHDGKIIECPIERADPALVYQQVVCNEIEGGYVEDLRVPVVADEIPFVYAKYRPVTRRFSNANSWVELRETAAVFSPEVQDRIRRVCALLGLEVGELDVLRDRSDSRIYVIDVNRTCYGPPNNLPFAQRRSAVERLARSFQRAFLANRRDIPGPGPARPTG